MGKREFAAVSLNPEHKTDVVHITYHSSIPLVSLESSLLDVYPSRRPQISGLIAEEAYTKVFAKYSNFADVFSPDLAFKLPKHTVINDYTIELVDS